MPERLEIPAFLKNPAESPCIVVDAAGANLCSPSPDELARIGEALGRALDLAAPGPVAGQGLVKVHVGEEKCVTSMRPEYGKCAADWLLRRGAASAAAGDTTVAYTGPRGHKRNPPGDASEYLDLARRQGWSADGPAGMPFVVLDRPVTSVAGGFAFTGETEMAEVEGVQRYGDFSRSGGFAAAGFTVNFAHLTLHGLAGVAGCVKSVAMGLAGLRGKLRMHQSLLPSFDAELCVACGRCVENCPEDALSMPGGGEPPAIVPERCIGCGECEAICAPGKAAVSLAQRDIADWERGRDTLPYRMADYAVGLMNGRWGRMVHVMHWYSVTERCDCLNVRQKPMTERNLGFVVGRNPFAVDRVAAEMLEQALPEDVRRANQDLLATARLSAEYAEEAYAIAANTLLETVKAE